MNERRFLLDTKQHRDNAALYIGNIDTSKPKEIIVREYIEHRTSKANARLWALHAIAADHTGHSAEEMHEFALMRHYGTKEIRVGDITQTVPLKRSSVRNKKEFGEFMESTESWYIQEFGVWLDKDAA